MKTKKITLNELKSLIGEIIKENKLSFGTDEDPIDDYNIDDQAIYPEDYINYDYYNKLENIVGDFNSKIKNELQNILKNTDFLKQNNEKDSIFLEELYTKVLKPLRGTLTDSSIEYYVDKMVENKLKK